MPRWVAAICAGGSAVLLALPAYAGSDLDAVAQLLEQGQTEQAALQADQFLQLNPADAEMRFLRGVIATEQKQQTQAIQIFSALARDYPAMPEPYNNLAVLYAAQGQDRKAVDALEQAIRAQPGYATAHENLGDLYARMASQSYGKALELDSARQGIAPKQALIAQMAAGKAGAAVPVAALPTATAVPVPAAAPVPVLAPVQPAARVRAPEPAMVAPAAERISSATPLQLAAAEAARSAASASLAADAAPAAKATPSLDASPAAVEAAVQAWAKAWAQQDMASYLAAYSPVFKPADGSSLAAWTQSRRQRIEGKREISVSLSDLQVVVDGERATARFVQAYAAGALKSNSRKTLVLQPDQGQWRIVSETVGR
ncbi:tetratricopeptide (TPR) repeat protein [Comamonas sp. BIGb0152]|uniref:nuclear transport factor 2 family protein n=1 Tax=Comamonas sp. BIGb0152 TaxID=2940601 RepID=UPI002168757C|nr:tetratricopeptide repeat protein [Comamonas sp. BIGb0152]MCS4295478.1 tetratricopeptide (TPR) repeat protein [Comamonas sp. BIGb0152]